MHPWKLDRYVIHPHVHSLKVNEVAEILGFSFLCDIHFVEEFELSVLVISELFKSVDLIDRVLSEDN